MKSATIGTVKTKGREGISSPRKKELLGSSPQKRMQGSPKKGKISLRPGQKPLSVLDVRAGVMDGMSIGLQKTSIGENKWELGFSQCLEVLAPLLHKPKVKINDL